MNEARVSVGERSSGFGESMALRDVCTDERAVSPVIGVVLMVGITVALAAVIGTLVLGFDATAAEPDAAFRYEADEGATDGWGDAGDSSERFLVHHDGGDAVALDRVVVKYAGTPASSLSWTTVSAPSGSQWRPGETYVVEDPNPGSGGDFASGQQVLVVWTSDDGGSSQILERGTLP